MQKNKLYSEFEVRKIISLAMKRENSNESDFDGSGITHDELLQIGREAGIDEDNLKNAAERVRYTHSTDNNKLASDSTHISTERWVNGRLTNRQIENFFAELKQNLGLQSGWWGSSDDLKRLGDTYELSFHDSRVTLFEKNDGYLVKIHKSQFFQGSALESVILGIPLAFILGSIPAAAVNDFFGVFWAVMTIVIFYALSFSFVKRYTNNKREKVYNQLSVIANESEKIIRELVQNQNDVNVKEYQQVDLPDKNTGSNSKLNNHQQQH